MNSTLSTEPRAGDVFVDGQGRTWTVLDFLSFGFPSRHRLIRMDVKAVDGPGRIEFLASGEFDRLIDNGDFHRSPR